MLNTKIKKLVKKLIRYDSVKNQILTLDFSYAADNKVVVVGWCANKESAITTGLAADLGKSSCDIQVMEFPRPDVKKSLALASNDHCFGFLAIVDCPKSQFDKVIFSHSGINFPTKNMRLTNVESVKSLVAHAGPNPENASDFLAQNGIKISKKDKAGPAVINRPKDPDIERIKKELEDLKVNSDDFSTKLVSSTLPAIHKIWKTRQAQKNDVKLLSFGDVNENAKLSIVVPLYGRYDFMQLQISQFSKYPDFDSVELVYVLDDPMLAHEVRITAKGIYETFGMPFKVVFSERNLGFAGANNLGVEYATSENLLLLNSDIMPKHKGWVTEYLKQFENTENCGILGATLVYEDETIQHAGMEFRKDEHFPGIWMNHHPFKGFPVELVNLPDVFESPLTTGACMLMKTSLYRELGGFEPLFVLGDFEDSDLCLKVHNKGLKVAVSSTVVLYHLERLSQDLVDSGDWKFKLTLLNGVYQVSRWEKLIKELAK
ncbi:glycosyltransferase family 2 protein [Psychrosphaera haliotis]|uniref:Glycosyltransferase n=1 Tax=Psychrosphaera haliotis TaxID=555083 RepID=A0A6N8F960_9GAMM|nr:glycosyltransferase family 2 protein [Psychrosphaera haliotis]MUH71372.1 glycosyltransferase [Psychrosphaera haliotis]